MFPIPTIFKHIQWSKPASIEKVQNESGEKLLLILANKYRKGPKRKWQKVIINFSLKGATRNNKKRTKYTFLAPEKVNVAILGWFLMKSHVC